MFRSVILDRLTYAAHGIRKRVSQPKRCPCCGTDDSEPIDRKFVYTLQRCRLCNILFRFPYEAAEEMKQFYDTAYQQKGLTTDLPDDDELAGLLSGNFSRTEKDFSRVINMLRALNVPSTARILDYGANWGYGTLQLQRAGYSVQAYEISSVRAAFGKKLGVHIETEMEKITGDFDVIYSSHVLEHTPNPLQTIQEQLGRIRDGGFVIAHTPNGSALRRRAGFRSFHKHWGLVHPVLLSDEFVTKNFGRYPVFMSSKTADGLIRSWNGTQTFVDQLEGAELLLIIRNSAAK